MITFPPIIAYESEAVSFVSPLLIHTVLWVLFTIWAGLVLFLPQRGRARDEFDDADEAVLEAERAGAKAAAVVLFLADIVPLLMAAMYREIIGLIVAGGLGATGLIIAYLVRHQIRASRVALGAALLAALMGGLIAVQFAHRSMWTMREKNAAKTLREIHEAQERYFERYNEVATLEQLAENQISNGPKLEAGRRLDYMFEIRPDLQLGWICTATPNSPLPCVLAYFYLDNNTKKLRYSRGRPADYDSPPWEK